MREDKDWCVPRLTATPPSPFLTHPMVSHPCAALLSVERYCFLKPKNRLHVLIYNTGLGRGACAAISPRQRQTSSRSQHEPSPLPSPPPTNHRSKDPQVLPFRSNPTRCAPARASDPFFFPTRRPYAIQTRRQRWHTDFPDTVRIGGE